MYIYKKKKRLNVIKQHLQRLCYTILAFIGLLFLVNQGIDYLRGTQLSVTHTFIFNRAEAKEEAPDVFAFLSYMEKKSRNIKKGEFSAYNAEVGQTDADPLTMASGKRVYFGAIANNCLPFGSKVKVNGAVYIVEDRMSSRYGCDTFDVFLWDKSEALAFGRKMLEYEIL